MSTRWRVDSKKLILDVVLYVFQTLDLDASFEATPLEESINTVGKSHLCDCGYATIDKSNFNKHMKRCSQSTLAVAPAPDGPSTSGTHVCDQCGKFIL